MAVTAEASRLRGSPLPCGTRPSPSSLFLLLLHIHSSSSSATAALYTTGHGNPSRVSLGSPPVSLLHHDSLWNSRQQWQQQQCDSQPPPAAAAALYPTGHGCPCQGLASAWQPQPCGTRPSPPPSSIPAAAPAHSQQQQRSICTDFSEALEFGPPPPSAGLNGSPVQVCRQVRRASDGLRPVWMPPV
ncbi:unnamed protein product [Lampetra planeri]